MRPTRRMSVTSGGLMLLLAAAAAAQPGAPLRDLLSAARLGDVVRLRAALAAGADVNAGDPTYGQTALMRAAMFGQTGTAAALIAARARPDVAAVDGRTAMHWAAVGGSADVVRVLLRAGADVNVKAFDETPLGYAVDSGVLSVVSALIEAGATPASMRQPVADYVNLVLGNRWQDDRLAIARALVRTRRGLDRRDAQGRPLAVVVASWAHQTDAAAIARDLRDAGVDLAAKDADGHTALDVVRQKLSTERDAGYRAAVQGTLDVLEGRRR